VADDLDREARILLFRGGRQRVHAATLTHCVGAQQVDNAGKIARRLHEAKTTVEVSSILDSEMREALEHLAQPSNDPKHSQYPERLR